MTSKETSASNHDEIARLAYLNWERDGRPYGLDQKYWLEAEQQIKATGHLLISELRPPANQLPVRTKSNPDEKIKKSRRLQHEPISCRS